MQEPLLPEREGDLEASAGASVQREEAQRLANNKQLAQNLTRIDGVESTNNEYYLWMLVLVFVSTTAVLSLALVRRPAHTHIVLFVCARQFSETHYPWHRRTEGSKQVMDFVYKWAHDASNDELVARLFVFPVVLVMMLYSRFLWGQPKDFAAKGFFGERGLNSFVELLRNFAPRRGFVMVSYAWSELEWPKFDDGSKLPHRLAQLFPSRWLDIENFVAVRAPGPDTTALLQGCIEQAVLAILLITPRYFASNSCPIEFEAAMRKPPGEVVIFFMADTDSHTVCYSADTVSEDVYKDLCAQLLDTPHRDYVFPMPAEWFSATSDTLDEILAKDVFFRFKELRIWASMFRHHGFPRLHFKAEFDRSDEFVPLSAKDPWKLSTFFFRWLLKSQDEVATMESVGLG